MLWWEIPIPEMNSILRYFDTEILIIASILGHGLNLRPNFRWSSQNFSASKLLNCLVSLINPPLEGLEISLVVYVDRWNKGRIKYNKCYIMGTRHCLYSTLPLHSMILIMIPITLIPSISAVIHAQLNYPHTHIPTGWSVKEERK